MLMLTLFLPGHLKVIVVAGFKYFGQPLTVFVVL